MLRVGDFIFANVDLDGTAERRVRRELERRRRGRRRRHHRLRRRRHRLSPAAGPRCERRGPHASGRRRSRRSLSDHVPLRPRRLPAPAGPTRPLPEETAMPKAARERPRAPGAAAVRSTRRSREPDGRGRACPGITLSLFEQRFPEQVRRYAFDRAMLEPFVQLWHAARRPDLPLRPERVTVYALPGLPFLIGYQTRRLRDRVSRRRAPASPAIAAASDRLVRLSPARCPNPRLKDHPSWPSTASSSARAP